MSTWTAPITWTAASILTAAQLNAEVRDHCTFLKGALDVLTDSTTADTGTTMYLAVTRPTSTDITYAAKVTGSAIPQWVSRANGTMNFGDGTTYSLVMSRPVAGMLQIDANGSANASVLRLESTAANRSYVEVRVAGDTSRLLLGGDATFTGLALGSGSTFDSQIQRVAAKSIQVNDGGGGNAYFSVPGGVSTLTKAGNPADGDFAVTPVSGTLAVDTTNSRIYVRVGATWKYAALT